MLVGQDQLWGSFMLMVQAPKLGRWLQGKVADEVFRIERLLDRGMITRNDNY